MRLLIANFDCQNIVSKDQVVRAVKRLPRSHYAGIQAIRYDPYRTLGTMVAAMQNKPFSPHTEGFFYRDPEYNLSVIVVFRFHSLPEFYHILYHEIGHYVFLKVLNQNQRDEWLYSVRRAERKWVSRRARQNAKEDFAETYAYFCTIQSRLSEVPRKAAFFRYNVFEGMELPALS